MAVSAMALNHGSSPLARGLPGVPLHVGRGHGIIPARAGFTCMAVSAMALNHGSSPLARGLPGVPLHVGRGHGIIPARAGFTRDGRRRRPWRADHPRSRGVYEALASGPYQGPGSSPLARGLPFEAAFAKADTRIIPARAGFTYVGGEWANVGQDHPRSRGVYSSPASPGTPHPGSSPLARGLHRGPRGRADLVRIIPARAGFTGLAHVGGARGPDHPRSRGVYYEIGSLGMSHSGSSPLARGLRGRPVRRVRAAGIIPARAGFTAPSTASTSPLSDHPRSRGVYWCAGPLARPAGGSSPLARGLRGNSRLHRRPERIIPARAGFTRRASAGTAPWQDHPRSRGVYRSAALNWSKETGSSPLARGLRPPPQDLRVGGRIIPARAGFTAPLATSSGSCGDHPRSRGVYEPLY